MAKAKSTPIYRAFVVGEKVRVERHYYIKLSKWYVLYGISEYNRGVPYAPPQETLDATEIDGEKAVLGKDPVFKSVYATGVRVALSALYSEIYADIRALKEEIDEKRRICDDLYAKNFVKEKDIVSYEGVKP